WHRAGRGFRRS
ncbi:hypothetical protein CDAR_11661, partial [Caerostris darwini]